MDLNLLPTFVTVAETRSFTEAARKLGLPRSSVSRSVAALEDSLRVQLFSRTTRHVSLTAAGESLLAQIAPELTAMYDALSNLPERNQVPAGDLRLTAPNDFGSLLLPNILVGFSQRYPAVRLDVRLTNRNVDLVAEGFDVALRVSTNKLKDSSLVARRLSNVEMQVYGAPTYIARAGTPRTPAEALEHDWVGFRGFVWPSAFSKLKAKQRLIGDDLRFVHQAVRGGAGLGILPTFLVADDVSTGRLLRILPRVSLAMGTLYFVHPLVQHLPRKITALRDFLLEYFTMHPMAPR